MTQDKELLEHIDTLIDIGIALSAEKDINRLLEMILLQAKDICHADAGTLYKVIDDKYLEMAIMRTDSLGIAKGGSAPEKVEYPPIDLYLEDGSPNLRNVVCYAVHERKAVNIPDAYQYEGFDFSGMRKFDQSTGYHSQSFLTVPMQNHEGRIIGVLQLINAQDPESGEIIPFSDQVQGLVESLASQAAVALTNRQLIQDLENLVESIIQLIATAIDEKSPYTGGHCRRVPVLTMMLADAASGDETGPLKDFHMSDEDRYELKIAAWLHDCGKITTPVHVVDKATKLETIFDRIELVSTRYEVLKRDAEIALLKQQINDLRQGEQVDPEVYARKLATTHAELDSELEQLRKHNLGSEFMEEEEQQWVRDVARRHTWYRNGESMNGLTDDEVYNLTIARGTLTPEEREIINNHIVLTIKMLESLPLPRHLRHVPEYAGGHHERMDGKGYPRGLTGDQMSVQARVMAIADIFEALTAKDRPYKDGKTLSEALRILGFMKKDHHIDPDLFDLFVRERLYMKYAEEYLDKRQIDEVDVSKIPGYRLPLESDNSDRDGAST